MLRFDRYSLKAKLSGLFLGILLFSLLIQIFYIIPHLQEHELAHTGEMQLEIAKDVAYGIDAVLRNAQQELENAAQLPEIKSMEPEKLDSALATLDSTSSMFLNYWVVDANGVILSRPDKPERAGSDRSEREYYQGVMATGKTHFTNFYVSTAGHLTTTVGTPIRNEDGAIVGVLVGSLGVDERNLDLFRVVTDQRFGKNGFAYLVDRNGMLIAHPNVKLTPENLLKLDYSDYSVVKEVIKGGEGVREYEYNGEPWVAAYSVVGSLGWGIVVQQPKADILEYIRSLTSFFFAIFVLLFLGSGIGAILFVRQMIMPLSRLREDIGPDKYEKPQKTKDEVKLLAHNIRKMVERIKDSEEALRESEERYRTLFEDSKDAVYITSRDGKFVEVNQSALDLFGYTRKEMVELDVLKIYVNHDARKRFQDEIEQKDSVRNYEMKFQKKDGTKIDCLVTSTVRRTEDGKIFGYQGIIRDITEQKKAEKELKQKLEELEKMNRLMVGRELKMIELKEQIKELEAKIAWLKERAK